MPFAEALYLELQEDRYINSAQFFKNILAKEYMFSKSSNYVPTLMKNKGRMKQLTSFLKIAERFSKKSKQNVSNI